MAADVHTMASMNELPRSGCSDAEEQKRVIPYIFVARRIRGLGRDFNLWRLGRLLDAGGSPLHGELYSYPGFSPELAERLIARGRQDAEEWFAAHHDDPPWQIGEL